MINLTEWKNKKRYLVSRNRDHKSGQLEVYRGQLFDVSAIFRLLLSYHGEWDEDGKSDSTLNKTTMSNTGS